MVDLEFPRLLTIKKTKNSRSSNGNMNDEQPDEWPPTSLEKSLYLWGGHSTGCSKETLGWLYSLSI